MKQTLIVILLTLIFISCSDHKNSGAASNTDSAAVNSTMQQGSEVSDSSSSHATGTTGTGTVSDSGNAANPGSDTSHK